MKARKRYFYQFGLLAPVIFIITALLGGFLRPGYSHLRDTVSELFTVGSPNRLLLSFLYILFSVFLILFGFGLLEFVRKTGSNNKIGKWGAVSFILVGAFNILTATIFPQDPWGAPPTFPGEMHKIVSAVISVLSLMYMLLFGIWFYKIRLSRFFLVYSLITILLAVLGGAWFMISVSTPLMGLAERAAILVGFQYTVVLAVLVSNNLSAPIYQAD